MSRGSDNKQERIKSDNWPLLFSFENDLILKF